MPRQKTRRELSAGGVVYRLTNRGPEFLLIKAGGRWSFPKGNVEKDESPQAAALREIAEETGLPRTALRLARQLPDIEYAFRWEGRLVFKTVRNFLVEARGDTPLAPQLSEIEEARWFQTDAARKALSFKNSLETLDAAIAAVQAPTVRS